MTGLVYSYNATRGFGWITPLIGKPDTTPRIFFHATAIRDRQAIPRGAEVSFTVVRGEKGPQCADVRLLRRRLEENAHG